MGDIDLISYDTFKRKNNPTIYEFRDGVKGWIRETIEPTLISDGWKRCIQEYDYSLFYDEKPKAMAKRLLMKEWGEEWVKDKQFVYYASRCYKNDFQDGLYVYFKPKERE